MKKVPRVFGIHAKPTKLITLQLMLLPFAVFIITYMFGYHVRHQVNPHDRIMPGLSDMVSTTYQLAFVEDEITGNYIMLLDTYMSLKRMGIGLAMAALLGLIVGLHMGVFPGLNTMFEPFIVFISIIPPLAILPILFIVFQADEIGKMMLIFFGSFFFVVREIKSAVTNIPKERIVKALTLGASQFQLTYNIILPEILPRLIDIIRACIPSAWLFLISAEAIVANSGLGYRIFLSQRNNSMNIIIPYDMWITFLGFSIDYGLKRFNQWKNPWYAITK